MIVTRGVESMATASPPLARQRTPALLPAIARLAWWRFKRMWHVLLVTWLGMVTMVMLVCAVPLFSQVAMTAGVRNAFNSAPPYEQRITFTLASSQPTTEQIQQAGQSIAQVVNANLASYTSGAAHFSVQVPALTITSGGTVARGTNSPRLLGIDSYTMDQITNEVTVVQGQLPQAAGNTIEIALTQDTAHSLGVHAGSVISATLPRSLGGGTWTLRVAGIFSPKANWESANTFQVQRSAGGNIYPVLAANSGILPKIAPLQVQLTLQNKRVFRVGGDVPFFRLNWSYPFDSSQVTVSNAGTLAALANTVQSDIVNRLSNLQGTFFVPNASGVLFDVLPVYYQRIYEEEIVVSPSLFLILGLALFLSGLMTAALIERQAAAIAAPRSRGAAPRHVFCAFAAP